MMGVLRTCRDEIDSLESTGTNLAATGLNSTSLSRPAAGPGRCEKGDGRTDTRSPLAFDYATL
jgi:hypothetical protein